MTPADYAVEIEISDAVYTEFRDEYKRICAESLINKPVIVSFGCALSTQIEVQMGELMTIEKQYAKDKHIWDYVLTDDHKKEI